LPDPSKGLDRHHRFTGDKTGDLIWCAADSIVTLYRASSGFNRKNDDLLQIGD